MLQPNGIVIVILGLLELVIENNQPKQGKQQLKALNLTPSCLRIYCYVLEAGLQAFANFFN
ncbi:MAG: hypothetical protein FJ190_00540 [Gammaproteobacteria bacterium]|nr:hypothetical protein [Gammaproteobacteria bacterium]